MTPDDSLAVRAVEARLLISHSSWFKALSRAKRGEDAKYAAHVLAEAVVRAISDATLNEGGVA